MTKEKAAEIAAKAVFYFCIPFVVLFVGAKEAYRTVRRWVEKDDENAERLGHFVLGAVLILLAPLLARAIAGTCTQFVELCLANRAQLSQLVEECFRLGLLGTIAILGYAFCARRRFRWEVVGLVGACMLLVWGARCLGYDLSWIRAAWAWLRDPHVVHLAKAAIEWIRAAA